MPPRSRILKALTISSPEGIPCGRFDRGDSRNWGLEEITALISERLDGGARTFRRKAHGIRYESIAPAGDEIAVTLRGEVVERSSHGGDERDRRGVSRLTFGGGFSFLLQIEVIARLLPADLHCCHARSLAAR